MTPAKWESLRDSVADAVAVALGLEEDLVVSEIRTAESQEEAMHRLELIRTDVSRAMGIVRSFSPHGPKDWTPKGRR